MAALRLYVTTCRYLLKSNVDDPNSWSDLYRYLPLLRQVLACCVCGNLLHSPMGPVESACQHHVCKECVGGKMRLKPSCSWCKDFENFQENPQLRILVQCFKKLCELIAASPVARVLADSSNNGGINDLMSIIREGLAVASDYNSTTMIDSFTLCPSIKLPEQKLPIQQNKKQITTAKNTSTQPANISKKRQRSKSETEKSTRVMRDKVTEHKTNGTATKHSLALHIAAEHDYQRSEATTSNENNTDPGSKELVSSRVETKVPLQNTVKSKASKKARLSGCQCGNATPNPGKLTCCGQRCPCYSSHKGCTSCRCRGCRNPRKEVKAEPLDNSSDIEINVDL